MLSRAISTLMLLALLAGVSACGGGGSSGSMSSTSSVTASEVSNAKGTLAMAGYQYIQVPAVQDAGPVKTKWTYLTTVPDQINKARSGEFDLINTGGDSISEIEALGVLQPIDTSLLSNWDSIVPVLRNDPQWKDSNGRVIGVPYEVIPAVTAYDTSKVAEAKRLQDLLKPEYRSGIALYDDPESLGEIAVAQGVKDTREMTKPELERAVNYLEELKPNIKTFFQTGEESQLFDSGAITVCIGTFGSILASAIEHNPAIKFNYLGEASFVSLWSIDRNNNIPADLNWIDRTLSQQGQEAIVKASGAYPAVESAVGALSGLGDPVSKATAETLLAQLLKEDPIFRGFSAEPHGEVVGVEEVTRAWNEYKTSF